MKIAILVPNYSDYSGDARVAAIQAKELSREGNEVTIFTFASDIKNSSINTNIMGMPRFLFGQRLYRLLFPLDFFKLWKWLPKFKDFDRVIAHIYPMSFIGYLVKKRYGIEYIFWFHGLEVPTVFPTFYERWYMKMFILFSKVTIQNADQIVSVSKFARDCLMQFMGMDSVVRYNKIDEQKFNKNVNGIKIRRKFNLGDAPVILSIGRLVPQKKFDLLIKAFYIIKKELPKAKLMIIGKPTFEKYYNELKKISDDSIIFIDFVPNDKLPYYYSMCNIYATCSFWENHNLPILESQACGKPVVAFDIESFHEQINEHGILVKKGDIKGFAKACINLIKRDRQDKI